MYTSFSTKRSKVSSIRASVRRMYVAIGDGSRRGESASDWLADVVFQKIRR